MQSSSISNKLFEQLNFRGERQNVIASNIANINTPNYKTKELVFQDELDNATNNTLKLKQTNSRHLSSLGSLNSSSQKLIEPTGLEEQA